MWHPQRLARLTNFANLWSQSEEVPIVANSNCTMPLDITQCYQPAKMLQNTSGFCCGPCWLGCQFLTDLKIETVVTAGSMVFDPHAKLEKIFFNPPIWIWIILLVMVYKSWIIGLVSRNLKHANSLIYHDSRTLHFTILYWHVIINIISSSNSNTPILFRAIITIIKWC